MFSDPNNSVGGGGDITLSFNSLEIRTFIQDNTTSIFFCGGGSEVGKGQIKSFSGLYNMFHTNDLNKKI